MSENDEAAAAADRLQRELSRRGFAFESRSYPFTFSAGAAQWRENESLEELIRRADGALYAAKRNGKNRVERA